MAFALLGAVLGIPEMKIPICAIAFSFFGTTEKSSLPTSFDCFGSSDTSALPVYWIVAPQSPPSMPAPC